MSKAPEIEQNSVVLQFHAQEDGNFAISTGHRFSEDFPEEAYLSVLGLVRGIIVACEVDPQYLQKMAYASHVGVELQRREEEIDRELQIEEMPDGPNIAKLDFGGKMQ